MQQDPIKKTLKMFGSVLVKAGESLRAAADKIPDKPVKQVVMDDFRNDPQYRAMAKSWLNLVKNHRNR